MKKCLICGALVDPGMPTCPKCGEASFAAERLPQQAPARPSMPPQPQKTWKGGKR
jgi:hypothetical protein